MATFLCFAIPFLWPLISALFLLPADQIRKILPRVFIESTLLALGLTFLVFFIIALRNGVQPLLDVQRDYPGLFLHVIGLVICVSFLYIGGFRILQFSKQLDRQKREFDAETEFSATDKPRPQHPERTHP